MFIPIDWGRVDADGEFLTTRSTISGLIAVFLTFVFCVVFENLYRFRNENRQYFNFMKEKTIEIQKELDALQDQYSARDTFAHERRELCILNKLQKELEQHVFENN